MNEPNRANAAKTELPCRRLWMGREGSVIKGKKPFILHLVLYINTIIYGCSFICPNSFALTITSSPNPVGSGARALGIGSAFIAVADDATAASWNPAGLTQLKKPEFSFAFSLFRRREDYSSRKHPEAEGMQEMLTEDLNYMSIVYPFELFNRNMTISLNYQRLYEFDRDIEINYFSSYPNNLRSKQQIDFRQQGYLSAISPAYAIRIIRNFSLGFTFNFWTEKLFWRNGWETDTIINGFPYPRRKSTSNIPFKKV